ncbi:venom protease-like [Zootermopsis nevadensis]|uniref:venom protease-like n=1 Tax=Zootermopsis nevadensis TaxID=136037 RepID=UPI000B8E7669|nr:venom protease-like [Zootermopsis nevadensis]
MFCIVRDFQSTCKNIDRCQIAKDELKRGNVPSICGFEARVPIVCCPSVQPISTEPTRSPPTAPVTPTQENTSGGKSKQKCKEYSSFVYTKDGVTVLVPGYESKKVSQCVAGKTLIIGGVEAEPKEFPHMAAIGYGAKNQVSWACGGTLISERFILTAAHCVSSADWGLAKWVRLGDLNLRSTDDKTRTQDFSIAQIFRHPGYAKPAHYNDIGLLKLDRDVKFDGYVRPACLHVEQDIPTKMPEAIGWGLTDWIGSKGSDVLLKVGLNFVNPEICNDTFGPLIGGRELRVGITADSMLCVGDLNGGKDTCKGDSGGPLHIRLSEPYCMFDVMGITSFGTICGSKNAPAVYTRVSHYVPWIESIVWS